MAKSLGQLLHPARPPGARATRRRRFATCWCRCPTASKLNFTFDGLKAADDRDRAPAQLQAAAGDRPVSPKASAKRSRSARSRPRQAFRRRPDDDLNTAEALGAVFEFVRDTNTAMDSGEFKPGNVKPRARLSRTVRLRLRRAQAVTPAESGITDADIEAQSRRTHGGQEGAQFRPRRRDSQRAARTGRDPGRHQGRSALEEK